MYPVKFLWGARVPQNTVWKNLGGHAPSGPVTPGLRAPGPQASYVPALTSYSNFINLVALTILY